MDIFTDTDSSNNSTNSTSGVEDHEEMLKS